MARSITPKVVREWALCHLKDPDGVTYNRFARAAARIEQLEVDLNKTISKNDALQLQLLNTPLIAHRVRQEQSATPAH